MNFCSISVLCLSILSLSLGAQSISVDSEVSDYDTNIKKEYINDIYIPKDLDDALAELTRLSDPKALEKFKAAEEEMVSKKLHFGLGRWITINWHMYNGSRFSHFLRMKGISFPDDMAKFVIGSFHRHLNGIPLEVDQRIEVIKEKRRRENDKRIQKQTLIKEYTKKVVRKNN